MHCSLRRLEPEPDSKLDVRLSLQKNGGASSAAVPYSPACFLLKLVQRHHLVPRVNEIGHELLFGAILRIDLGDSTKLGV